MKKYIIIALGVALVAGTLSLVQAREVVLQGKGATEYQVIADLPGNVTVSQHYRNAITLHKLKDNQTAFWNPHSGKYISAGDYAYLWCAVYKKGKTRPSHHWIAVTERALDQALDMNHASGGAIGFYTVTKEGDKLALRAYPYHTLRSMQEGVPVVPVKQ